MNLRVIQWNISFLNTIDKKINYLLTKILLKKCVFILEEVRREDFEVIKNRIDYNFIYSLDIRKPGKFEGRNRKLGVLIGFSKDIKILSSGVIERSLFPERTLFAEMKLDGIKINILGFHSLTGVDYKKAKSAQFAAIADFLNDKQFNFLCFDANEPKIDCYDISKLEFFDQKGDKGKPASLVFGVNRSHELSDSFRDYISIKKEEYLYKSPLEVSFIVTGDIKKRYDYIFSSSNWKVINLEYLYKESVTAGSDHALVLGGFRV
ncbi:MAG: hypothetical protein PHH52_00620 [Patescibacteria group bacterium]|nr:hypothetical protein [Patescibacteria group bacterium]